MNSPVKYVGLGPPKLISEFVSPWHRYKPWPKEEKAASAKVSHIDKAEDRFNGALIRRESADARLA